MLYKWLTYLISGHVSRRYRNGFEARPFDFSPFIFSH